MMRPSAKSVHLLLKVRPGSSFELFFPLASLRPSATTVLKRSYTSPIIFRTSASSSFNSAFSSGVTFSSSFEKLSMSLNFPLVYVIGRTPTLFIKPRKLKLSKITPMLPVMVSSCATIHRHGADT